MKYVLCDILLFQKFQLWQTVIYITAQKVEMQGAAGTTYSVVTATNGAASTIIDAGTTTIF